MCRLPSTVGRNARDVRHPERTGGEHILRRERALDRMSERQRRHGLIGRRREPEPASDVEGVGAPAVGDARHRRGDLGSQDRARSAGCVRVGKQVRAGRVHELPDALLAAHRVGVDGRVRRGRDAQRLAGDRWQRLRVGRSGRPDQTRVVPGRGRRRIRVELPPPAGNLLERRDGLRGAVRYPEMAAAEVDLLGVGPCR
jgi:hypothetical protein